MEFAGYKDVIKLGEGPNRVTYSALRISDQKPIILKVLRHEHPEVDLIALMYHEYDITKDLDFSGIIQTYEVLDQQNRYALVQENIHGITLYEFMQQYRLSHISDFLNLAIPMTKILGELNQRQVIHKDIKPDSFIINPKSQIIKLTDFSFSSKLTHETQEIVPPSRLEGTLGYMSPEQTGRMNMNIDYRSDFYSLGVTFYHLLTNKLPFSNTDPLEILHAHLANPVPELANPNMDIPPVIIDIVKKLMSKNPADRYQSANGLLQDLETCKKLLDNTGAIKAFNIGEQDVSDRLNLSQKLYGREDAAGTLLAAYDRVSKGATEILMVCGYSGIGKTMLINEVHKPMVQHKGYFIRGKFDQLQRDTPYTAITQAFNHLVQLILAEPEDRFERLKTSIVSALGGTGQMILDLAPDMELIIGPQPALEILPPQQAQNRMNVFFKRFLNAIATEEHPLVLFIDDLQWIDRASLNLFETMMLDEELSYFFLIGTYRDNEVDDSHPLTGFMEIMKENECTLNSIRLSPLTVENFSAFFQDSFKRSLDDVTVFAELIHQRTNGNPFFCKQVIHLLHQEKLLHFNYEKLYWDWDLTQINALEITDNVVELMLSKLVELNEETQFLLRYAACVGNRFSIEMLMLISGKSADAIGNALWPALQQDLILSLRLGYKRVDAMRQVSLSNVLSKEITYQFIHDRVQQAVYQGITPEEMQQIHVSIARILLEKDSESCKKERLFEVTDHFNKAHSLLSKDERIMVAELNNEAAMQAKNSNAYQPMTNYIQAALQLLDDDSWNTHYELTFKLNSNYALSLFLLGKTKEAEQLTAHLSAHAKTKIDKITLYRIQILSFNSQGDLKNVLETGKRALALLDINFVTTPSGLQILNKLFSIRWKMRHFNVEHLDTELKEISDPNMIIAFDIFAELLYPSFFKGTEHFVYLNLLAMELILEHGRPDSAGLWMATYGFILINTSKNVDLAYKYIALAHRFFDESPDKYSSGFAFIFMGFHMNHLRYHFKEGHPKLARAYSDSLESGNIVQSKHALNTKSFNTVAEARSIEQIIMAFKLTLKGFLQWQIKHFLELAIADTMYFESLGSGIPADEEKLKHLGEVIKQSNNLLVQSCFHRDSCYYYFFCEQYERAYHFHQLWYPHEDKIRFDASSYEAKVLAALILIREIPNQKSATRRSSMKHFNKVFAELTWVSKINPKNYQHHYLFLKAGKQQLAGDFLGALSSLNSAIENAKLGDFYLWVALGNELAADLNMSINQPNAAESYILESYYYYERFGMKTKVAILEQRFNTILNKKNNKDDITTSSQHPQSDNTIKPNASNFAFRSVIQANQTISGEIKLDKLISQMLHIVLEHAGANKALFLEIKGEACMVVAGINQHDETKKYNLFNVSCLEYKQLPLSVIQFSLRSKKMLVLDNAIATEPYNNDPYIINAQPKSILCLPVTHLTHSKLLEV